MSIYGSDEVFGGGFAAAEGVVAMLQASPQIVATYFIDSTADIYAHNHPEDVSERFLVVRRLGFIGGSTSNHAKIDDVTLQVMAMIRDTLSDGSENPNVERWLDAMHRRIHKVIVGQSPSLHVGSVLLPLRLEQYPSTASLDQQMRYWYSTAQYNVTLAPITI